MEPDVLVTIDEIVARACHEVNRSYCDLIGDYSQVAWADAPQWQRDSAINGVALAAKGATPEELHESWSDQKRADGWAWGPVKDAEAKTHPCLVPYAELPAEQKVKDLLFHDVAYSLLAFLPVPDPEDGADPGDREY